MMEKKVDKPVVESKQQKLKRTNKKVNVLQQRFEQKIVEGIINEGKVQLDMI